MCAVLQKLYLVFLNDCVIEMLMAQPSSDFKWTASVLHIVASQTVQSLRWPT